MAGNEMLRSQRLENLLRIVKVRTGFINTRTIAREILRRLCAYFSDFRVNRAMAEVRAVGNPAELRDVFQAIHIACFRRWQAAGIENMRARHHIKEQRRIRHIPSHGSFHRIGRERQAERPMGDPLRRRAKADNTSKACGRA